MKAGILEMPFCNLIGCYLRVAKTRWRHKYCKSTLILARKGEIFAFEKDKKQRKASSNIFHRLVNIFENRNLFEIDYFEGISAEMEATKFSFQFPNINYEITDNCRKKAKKFH